MPQQQASATYKIKRVHFFDREVQIFTQNLNGPCPLLAIANVLSLREELKLPPNAPDISESKLIALVAEHYLDTNSPTDEKSEYAVNLRQNLNDGLEVLHKLRTGIDVNVKFDSPDGFELTREVLIFDLLRISLLHGWLVDPQDESTAKAFGDKSYNEVVELLVALETPNQAASSSVPLTLGSEVDASNIAARGPSLERATTEEQLQQAIALSLSISDPVSQHGEQVESAEPSRPTNEGESAPSPIPSSEPSIPQASVEPGLISTVAEPPDVDAATATASHDATETVPHVSDEPLDMVSDLTIAGAAESNLENSTCNSHLEATSTPQSESADKMTNPVKFDEQMPHAELQNDTPQVHEGRQQVPEIAQQSIMQESHAPGMDEGTNSEVEQSMQESTTAELVQHADSDQCASSDKTPESTGHAISLEDQRQLLLMRNFLDQNCSQLTIYGLSRLCDTIKEHELAVFFRNNHFCTIFRHQSQLYLLVTDQGYLSEPDVVWERLDAVDGDTQLCTCNFEPFVPGMREQAPPNPEHVVDSDADFALALQLQEEERMRQEEHDRRVEEQRRQQQLQQLAQAQQPQQPQTQQPQQQPMRQQAVAQQQQSQQQTRGQQFSRFMSTGLTRPPAQQRGAARVAQTSSEEKPCSIM